MSGDTDLMGRRNNSSVREILLMSSNMFKYLI
nr:MAG TPA: hypothetical protein [Caudoviricetes sp.]